MRYLFLMLLISLNASAGNVDFRQMIVSQCANDATLAVRIQYLRQKTGTNHNAFNATIRQTAATKPAYDKQLEVGRWVYLMSKDMPYNSLYGLYLRSCLKKVRDKIKGTALGNEK